MTVLDLAELRELWKGRGADGGFFVSDHYEGTFTVYERCGDAGVHLIARYDEREEADFLCVTLNALPGLLDRIDTLTREVAAQEITLEGCARLLGDDMPRWEPRPVREVGCERCGAAEAEVVRLRGALTGVMPYIDSEDRGDTNSAKQGALDTLASLAGGDHV